MVPPCASLPGSGLLVDVATMTDLHLLSSECLRRVLAVGRLTAYCMPQSRVASVSGKGHHMSNHAGVSAQLELPPFLHCDGFLRPPCSGMGQFPSRT